MKQPQKQQTISTLLQASKKKGPGKGTEKDEEEKSKKSKEKSTETNDANDANDEMEIDSSDDDEAALATYIGHSKKRSNAKEKEDSEDRQKKRKQRKEKPASESVNFVKKVNASSTNRRTCNRYRDEADDDTADTPEASNRRAFNRPTFSTRVGTKLQIKASATPERTFSEALMKLLEQVWEADEKACLLPWKERNVQRFPAICKVEDFPRETERLRKYMHRFFLPRENKDGQAYPYLHLGHESSFKELSGGIQPWLRSTNQGLYYQMLQSELFSDIGWFLYSTKEMDLGALSDAILEQLGIRVGLRWKVLKLDIRGQISEDKRIFAIHIEVDKDNRKAAIKKLSETYTRTVHDPSHYPNELVMRYIKLKSDCYDTASRRKVDKARIRQKAFTQNIVSYPVPSIVVLDEFKSVDPDVTEGPTLRQMIMQCKAKDGRPLYHGVDLDYLGNTYKVTFNPKYKDQAETTADTLIPRLVALHPTQKLNIPGYFDYDAQDAADYLEYDVEKDRIYELNYEGKRLNEDDDDEDDGMLVEIQADENLFRPIIRETRGFPSDNDSISTFRVISPEKQGEGEDEGAISSNLNLSSRQSGKFSISTPTTVLNSSTDDVNSVASATSSVTMGTVMTLQQEFRSHKKEANERAGRTEQTLNQILQLLQNGNQINLSDRESGPADRTGTGGDMRRSSGGRL